MTGAYSMCANAATRKEMSKLQGIIKCENSMNLAGPVAQCYDIKTEPECKAATDPVGKCLWCLAKAVPSVCVDPEQAKQLPEGVFVCQQP